MEQKPDVALREATPDDVPALLGLVRDLAVYEKAPNAVEMTEALLSAALFGETPLARAVLAEAQGKSLGFAIWFTSFSTWTGRAGLYLEDLFVAPHARGRGVGRALLRHLAREAIRLGCARLEWSVLDWNAPAITFYQSLGAEPLDEWTRYRLHGEALGRLAQEN
ncbi:GNAT family N-acetyltransferase [Acidiphilium sp. AL]|uniref:GNAT family N-acetyltransferase n=1 Tax=Acidiphilium iwatense TaxID=768198 RepID=A0ABS9DTR8_9PROT|nr:MULTISPECIES: GNAT family N-acetyltransferase [Acidiphilium]MCF3946123.1 GNAT family N-acetyltransferase [Acidiphilium iwatense]MCU4160993.1 GNAT family N-acetyltransferase [Acidiphilium sp. AL]